MAGVRRRLGLLLVPFVLIPTAASAHSNWVETNPEHGATVETLPTEATVTVNEAPQRANVVLARPDGRIVKLKSQIVGSMVKVRLPANGPRGVYTLSYRVVSTDGHPVSGSTTFTVTSGPTASTPNLAKEPARGPLVPIVIGVAVLGAAATVFAARSIRR